MSDDIVVGPHLRALVQHDADIEDELVARISLVADADRVAEDGVVVVLDADEVVREALVWDDELRDVGEGREEEGGGACWGWDDGTGGDLVDDFWTCVGGKLGGLLLRGREIEEDRSFLPSTVSNLL